MPSFNKSTQVPYLGILTTLALIFSYIETLIPLGLAIPGVKLGLANVVILFTLYALGPKSALGVNLLRIFLAGILFRGIFAVVYGLSGGLLSIAVMIILKKTKKFSIIGVSVAGSVFHNMGQLLSARLVMGTSKIFYYFPFLLFSGIVTGIFIGMVVYLLSRPLKPFFPSGDFVTEE